MAYKYTDSSPATLESAIDLNDAIRMVSRGRTLLACFDRYGTGDHARTTKALHGFLEALYGAGFVMSGFDGPQFDIGPMYLMFTPGVAPLVVMVSNLLTIRMFAHTLARGHRAADGGDGYPYFDRAYRTGGLRALIERCDQFCESARRQGCNYLREGSDAELIRALL